jgi:hypothetical protein
VIPLKVFKKKFEQDKSTRYKGRIVVKGYVQIPGLDFTDSFAPVVTGASIHLIFSISSYKCIAQFKQRYNSSRKWFKT